MRDMAPRQCHSPSSLTFLSLCNFLCNEYLQATLQGGSNADDLVGQQGGNRSKAVGEMMTRVAAREHVIGGSSTIDPFD
jgi:hypothetical protein